MIKITTILCVIVIISLSACSSGDAIEKQLNNSAEKINKTCPIRVTEFTRLDSLASLGNRTVCYYYSTPKENVKDMDTVMGRKVLREEAIAAFKSKDDMVTFNDLGVSIKNVYRDSLGSFITEFTITPEEYKR